MGDSECSEEYDTDDFYQQNGHAYFILDQEIKQQRILAEIQGEDNARKTSEVTVEETKAVGADDLNNPEQEGSQEIDAGLTGAKDLEEVDEDGDFDMRRQETVGFNFEADEVSFNEYREKVTEKERTQYLRTSIDSDVRQCQKISQL